MSNDEIFLGHLAFKWSVEGLTGLCFWCCFSSCFPLSFFFLLYSIWDALLRQVCEGVLPDQTVQVVQYEMKTQNGIQGNCSIGESPSLGPQGTRLTCSLSVVFDKGKTKAQDLLFADKVRATYL